MNGPILHRQPQPQSKRSNNPKCCTSSFCKWQPVFISAGTDARELVVVQAEAGADDISWYDTIRKMNSEHVERLHKLMTSRQGYFTFKLGTKQSLVPSAAR